MHASAKTLLGVQDTSKMSTNKTAEMMAKSRATVNQKDSVDDKKSHASQLTCKRDVKKQVLEVVKYILDIKRRQI